MTSIALDPASASRCLQCAAAPRTGQLRLLDLPAVESAQLPVADGGVRISLDGPGWPSVETSWSGRTGFWRERTPTVFGYRRGVGPLIVALDTAILISLRDELEVVEEGAGLVCGPPWSDLRVQAMPFAT